MARPSLADSLRASLNKGAHVETAEKIARGFSVTSDNIDSFVAVEPVIPSPIIHEQPSSCNNIEGTPNQPILLKKDETIIPLAHALSDGATVRQSHSQTAKHSDGMNVRQSDGATVVPCNSQTVKPSNSQTVSHQNDITVRLPQHQTVELPHRQTVSQYQTHYQTPMHYVPLEVLNLAYNQACVLEALIANTSGVTNYRAISELTHVGIPSAREALSRLVVKGFMHKPVTVKNAVFQGFSYVLNKALCDHFITAGGLGQENYNNHQTMQQTVKRSDSATVTLTDRQTEHSSSRFLKDLEPTTTYDRQAVRPSDHQTASSSDILPVRQSDMQAVGRSEGFVLTGAVGAYWEEEGLGEGQAKKWCSQFETLPEQMRQQLDWARFDLETNGRRAEVKKDTISWFFGHLRTTGGCFPRPVNYKSPVEIRAEALEKDLARERDAKERLAAAEFEQKFQVILTNPKSEEYLFLYKQVNSFAKEEQGMVLEHALRDVFTGEGRVLS